MANPMDDVLAPFRNPSAPPSIFGQGETPEQAQARVAAQMAQQQENFARNQQGAMGGAAAQVPGLAPQTAAPPQDGGMSIAPETVSEQANMSIAPPPMSQAQSTQQTQTQSQSKQAGTGLSVPHLSQKQIADEQKAYDAQVKAGAAIAEQQEAEALMKASDARYTAQKLQQKAQQDQADAAKIKQDSDGAVREWQGAIAERKKIQEKGPEKLSVGGEILAALAKGLGAFGSTMTGAPNYALDILNKAADARVRKWEKDLDEAKGNADSKQNLVAWFRQKGMDARAASAAARQSILDEAAVRGDELAAQYKGDAVKNTWAATKAGLDAQRVNLLNQRSLEEQDKRLRLMMAMQPKPMSTEDRIRTNALVVDVPQKDKDGNDIGYTQLMARSPADAEKVRQAMVVRDQIKSNIGMLREFMQKSAVHSVGPNATQIQTMADDLRTQFGVLRGLGALSDKDYKIASQLGDPSSMTQLDSTSYKLMDDLDKRLDKSVENELQARGLLR